eukprot:42570-Eustigmatos_ZCMA.PRE.1
MHGLRVHALIHGTLQSFIAQEIGMERGQACVAAWAGADVVHWADGILAPPHHDASQQGTQPHVSTDRMDSALRSHDPCPINASHKRACARG